MRLNITTFVRQAYFAYFDMYLGDQDKSWARHKVCKPCVEKLRQWTKGKRTHLSFSTPMVWREPMDHTPDCYLCQVKTVGYNERTRHKIKYPSLKSAILPIPHSDQAPILVFRELKEINKSFSHSLDSEVSSI